jgi:anti-anti-sigma factor
VSRVLLEGEYDLARQDEVARLFASLDGDDPIIIDVARVTYIDSTILKELGKLHLRSAGRTITLAGPSDHLRHVLEIVGFDQIFDIAE